MPYPKPKSKDVAKKKKTAGRRNKLIIELTDNAFKVMFLETEN